ncbi:hypothetical protein EP7_003257 [Isosphaeraceae bacterium EP7]
MIRHPWKVEHTVLALSVVAPTATPTTVASGFITMDTSLDSSDARPEGLDPW